MKEQKFNLNERKLFMLVKRYCRELGWDRGEPIEICLAGQAISGIDGDGTKWSPKLGDSKTGADAFIVIRRQKAVTPSEPNPELKQEHECQESTKSEDTPSSESTPKDEPKSGAGK